MKGGTTITDASSRPASPGAGRASRLALLATVCIVAAVRLWFCARLPVNTADILRAIHTALYALRDGPGVAGVPLVELDAGLQGLSWAGLAYSYPPLALPFFVGVAAISPTLFAAKLALTLVEAANASLVARITGSRWLGVIYWASPASIWWVSGEGQFEPLMALFMFAAVAAVRRRPALALALLGLGVNVKLLAILLLPWLLLEVRRERPEMLVRGAAAFAIALTAPILVAGMWYPVVAGLLEISGSVRYNPYYWNPFDASIFRWNPLWLKIVNTLASYGALLLLVYRAARSPDGWRRFGAAIVFVVLVKTSSLAQFWYFLLFPALLAPAEPREGEPDVRWSLIALTPLLDVRSLTELLFGPFGWVETAVYEGLTAFTPFGIR